MKGAPWNAEWEEEKKEFERTSDEDRIDEMNSLDSMGIFPMANKELEFAVIMQLSSAKEAKERAGETNYVHSYGRFLINGKGTIVQAIKEKL
jgi:hypothetical protein